MKNLGFNSGEIFLNSISEYEEDFANIILEQSLENDFKINSVHGFSSSFEPYLFDEYKRRRDDSFLQFEKICKFTKIVGADCYTFHGMRNKKLNEISKEFVFDIYDKLLYISKEKGIKLCQENVFWCMSGNIDFLYMLKERYEGSIYFTLDIKQAYRAGKIPARSRVNSREGRPGIPYFRVQRSFFAPMPWSRSTCRYRISCHSRTA